MEHRLCWRFTEVGRLVGGRAFELLAYGLVYTCDASFCSVIVPSMTPLGKVHVTAGPSSAQRLADACMHSSIEAGVILSLVQFCLLILYLSFVHCIALLWWHLWLRVCPQSWLMALYIQLMLVFVR